MASTKADRVRAGKRSAQLRRQGNPLAEGNRQKDPHNVQTPEDGRDTEVNVLAAYGVSRDAHNEPWVRPASLYAPEPRPGFTQRWIRIRVGSSEDVANSTRKFREGWLPRDPATVPKGDLPPTISHPRLGSVIGVEDLILCEMPIEKAKQRNAYYRQRIERMVEAIEQDINRVSRHGPRIRKSERTQVTYSRRRIPDDPTEEDEEI